MLEFQCESLADYPLLFTGVVIASLPIVLAYVLLQRWFVAGMTSGAVKGWASGSVLMKPPSVNTATGTDRIGFVPAGLARRLRSGYGVRVPDVPFLGEPLVECPNSPLCMYWAQTQPSRPQTADNN